MLFQYSPLKKAVVKYKQWHSDSGFRVCDLSTGDKAFGSRQGWCDPSALDDRIGRIEWDLHGGSALPSRDLGLAEGDGGEVGAGGGVGFAGEVDGHRGLEGEDAEL